MADHNILESSSASNAAGGSSESIVELNVKTLDSRIYSFHTDKNMPVSVLKEKITGQIGLPVAQQRLIFRGKVLKDDHLLSEYHVENGDTLHLVERQPSQPQPSPNASSGEASANNANRGQDPNAGGARNRLGQIAHSVVLGTFNVGDQGEGLVPDISRVIGAVLNSIGIANQPGAGGPLPTMQVPQGTERDESPVTAGSQSQAGSQPQFAQTFPGQSVPQVVHIPIGAAIAVPSLNLPIPDSLHTLSEFINRMEQALTRNGSQPNQSPNVTTPAVELPTNTGGLATPETLGVVLRQAQQLISNHASAALSHIAGRLERERNSTDPTVRGQIQSEAVQVGLAMQHLGAFLLELGRTTLTLRMGQSPGESFVNSGPAVYISPSGPNPIMVQPFPLQTNSLFGGPAVGSLNPGAFAPVGIGSAPRHVNIHIHAVGARPPNGVATGEHVHGTGSGIPVQSQVLPVININATAVSQPMVGSGSDAPQPDHSVDSGAENNRSNQSLSSSGSGVEGSQGECHEPSDSKDAGAVINSKDECSGSLAEEIFTMPGTQKEEINVDRASSSAEAMNSHEGSAAVPLGLGLGGLQPKRRSKLPKSQSKTGDGTSTSNQNDQPIRDGQQILQSLASLSTLRNENAIPLGQIPKSSEGAMESAQGQDGVGQMDVANAMSQVLRSPALDGLLTGVSQQTGVGSPHVLRNMLQQVTQNPVMMNTVNQIAQQIDTQDLGSMFSSIGGGQGGGIDLSRMFQQMMPIVSQALGGVSTAPRSAPPEECSFHESRPRREVRTAAENFQVDLQEVARRIEHQSPPGDIFRSMVENAVRLCDSGDHHEQIIDELCKDEGLADEFAEMLSHDISRRLQNETEDKKKL